MTRRTCRRFARPRRRTASKKRGALAGLLLGAAVATVLASPAGAVSSGPIAFWSRCSLHAKVAGVEVSPVEVLHLTCAQASRAIQEARILLTPGGPIFSTHGYTCSSTKILPPVDPSPNQLPAAERCTGAKHRQLAFIWDWAS
jgi:hypothetical protein